MPFQLSLAIKYLSGRKLRALLTTLSIVIGVMVMFGMGSLLPTALDAFKKSAQSASGQIDVTVTQKTKGSFSTSVLNRVKNVEGVRAAAGSIERTMNVPANFYGRDVDVPSLMLVGVDPVAGPTVRDYHISEGRFFKAGDSDVVVITASLADTLHLKLGDTLRIPAIDGVAKLTIVGLLPGRALLGNEEVLLSLAEAQKLLDMGGLLNTIEANLATGDSTQRDAAVQRIKTELGSNYRLNALSDESQMFASISAAQSVFNMLGVLTLFMSGFIIFNTFRTIVTERRHDIGMLRALGASRGTIIGLILAEGVVQGIVGTALGLVMGYLLAYGGSNLMSQMYRSVLSIQISQPSIDPLLLAVSIALGVGVTIVAGLLPAVSASRVTPIEVLRPSASEAFQRISRAGAVVGALLIVGALGGLFSGQFALVALGGLAFLAGLVLVAPVLVKPFASAFSVLLALAFARSGTGGLAQGNITRQPSRSAITASATMIGLAIVVGAGGMMWSMNDSLLGMFQKSMGSDYLLVPPAVSIWEGDIGAGQSLTNKLRSVSGVGTVTTLRYAQSAIPTVSVKGGSGESQITVLGIDPPTYREISGMDFQKGNANEAYTALGSTERVMIMNGILAATTGTKPGDVIILSTPQGQKDYRVVAVGGDVLMAKISTVYISQVNLKADFNKSEDVFVQLNLAQGADAAAVESRLRTIVSDYPQFRFIATRQYLDEFSKQFDAVFAGVYLMLAVLSLPSLIAILNTLVIGVIERTREIGMLRAIGAARRQVWNMIVAEALLLSAIGTALGLLGGLYLSYVLVQGIGAAGIFRMEYSFPLAGVLAATAAGLIFGVLAALLPARQASRMEIIKALRYE
ncbi:MAG: ABC transporter permease [Chloroflexi bacterium]|nr:ABC transporter permease [Chloroflexota bacterium]